MTVPYYAFPSNPKMSADTLTKFFPDKTSFVVDALYAKITTENCITYKISLGNNPTNIDVSLSSSSKYTFNKKITVQWSINKTSFYWEEEILEFNISYDFIDAVKIGKFLMITIPKSDFLD